MTNSHSPLRRQFVGLLVLLAVAAASTQAGSEPAARNAILYVGDGMGMAYVSAARILKQNAREGRLTFDRMPRTALVQTWCADTMVTDSAAAATAFACGVKTNRGAVGVSASGEPVESILSLAQREGKSVGIVTTTRVTDATPASFYAHVGQRGSEEEIADQLLANGRIDLIMGGGRDSFTGADKTDEESGHPGRRKDNVDLLEKARGLGYRVIDRQSQFDELGVAVDRRENPGKVLALFNAAEMNYEADRAGDKWGEPSLAQMTALAIKILKRNPKGYFLLVEGGMIDRAGHKNQARRALTDVLALNDALDVGLQSDPEGKETLILVTADHETGGLAINGYPDIDVGGTGLFTRSRGLGPGDILTFASGPGAERPAEGEGAPPVDKSSPEYRQPALILAPSALHTGVDVVLWGSGPGSEPVRGTLDNTDIKGIIARALGVE